MEAECRSHALNSDRETQATAALQLAQQQHSRCTAALTASQQQASNTEAEADLLRCQLQATDRSWQQLHTAYADSMAKLKQQLQDSNVARQQQREAAARARADAQAAVFRAARLAAQVASLQSQLAASEQQQEAARAAAESTINSLQQARCQVATEHDTAVTHYQTLQQQHATSVTILAATNQQLQVAHTSLSAATNQRAADQKATQKFQQQARSIITALQHKLDNSTQLLRQQSQTAAKALAAAAAHQFATARLESEKSSLEKQVSVLRVETAALVFVAARLTAHNTSPQAQLDNTTATDQQKLSRIPATAAAIHHTDTVQHAATQSAATDSTTAQQQQLAKVTACLTDTQQQLVSTAEHVNRLQQELQACRASQNSYSSSNTSHARRSCNTSTTAAALQQQQTYRQQQQQAAARAFARAQAAEWRVAKLAAQYKTLQQQSIAAASAAAATISSMQLQLQNLSQQHVAAMPEAKQCCLQAHVLLEAADVAAVLDCSSRDASCTPGFCTGTHDDSPVGVLASAVCSSHSITPGQMYSSMGPASIQLQQGSRWGSASPSVWGSCCSD